MKITKNCRFRSPRPISDRSQIRQTRKSISKRAEEAEWEWPRTPPVRVQYTIQFPQETVGLMDRADEYSILTLSERAHPVCTLSNRLVIKSSCEMFGCDFKGF